MFRRFGCGCVYLITQVDADDDNYPTHGRLVEYCGGDDSDLKIGYEVKFDEKIMSWNLPGEPLSADESSKLFDRINQMISKGYRFQELQRILKGANDGD